MVQNRDILLCMERQCIYMVIFYNITHGYAAVSIYDCITYITPVMQCSIICMCVCQVAYVSYTYDYLNMLSTYFYQSIHHYISAFMCVYSYMRMNDCMCVWSTFVCKNIEVYINFAIHFDVGMYSIIVIFQYFIYIYIYIYIYVWIKVLEFYNMMQTFFV